MAPKHSDYLNLSASVTQLSFSHPEGTEALEIRETESSI